MPLAPGASVRKNSGVYPGLTRYPGRPGDHCCQAPETLLRWHRELVRRKWAAYRRRPRRHRPAALLRDTHPGVGVVVLSQHDEPEYVLKLLERGSARRAYLLKDSLYDPAHLVAAVREVAAGGSLIDPLVVETLVASRSRQRGSAMWELTAREREVLSQMAQGCNNDTIATRLHLSVRMVEKHINSIFSKLSLSEESDVHRRVKAVLIHLSETGD